MQGQVVYPQLDSTISMTKAEGPRIHSPGPVSVGTVVRGSVVGFNSIGVRVKFYYNKYGVVATAETVRDLLRTASPSTRKVPGTLLGFYPVKMRAVDPRFTDVYMLTTA